jgi:nitrogen fixation NifU-like protein
VQIQLAVDEQGRIEQAYFDGEGCAISQAAASILCEAIEGKRLVEVEGMQAQDMLDMLKVPLTATRQRCGLLGFKVLKTIVYSIADDRRESGSHAVH